MAATPADWTPVTYATAIRAVSSGSSEKHSKPRPASGVRIRLMVGASRMSTPLPRASAPRAAASSRTSSGSQVAPSADGQGRQLEGLLSSRVVPRTPDGPSEVTIGRSPRASQPGIRQLSAPVSSRTLSSRGSAASWLRSPDI